MKSTFFNPILVFIIGASLLHLSFPLHAAIVQETENIWLEMEPLPQKLEAGSYIKITTAPSSLRIHLDTTPREVSYGAISTRINSIAANIGSTIHAGSEGILIDIDLAHNQTLEFHPGRNSVEVLFKDRREREHYTSFILHLLGGDPSEHVSATHYVKSSGQRYAVVFGISRYQYSGLVLTVLPYSDADATAIREVLIKPAGGDITASHMKSFLNEDATLEAFKKTIRFLSQNTQEGDIILFYLNQHGIQDPAHQAETYLAFYDSNPSDLGTTAIPITSLPGLFKAELPERHLVVITDICHTQALSSGSSRHMATNLVNQYLSHALELEGIPAIEASDIGQTSHGGAPWHDHGAFSYFLLKGIEGEADFNHDLTITDQELFRYVRQKVTTSTDIEQTPLAGVGNPGEVPISGSRTTSNRSRP